MKLVFAFCFAIGLAAAAPAVAEVGDKLNDNGLLNPEQLTIEYFADHYDFGKGSAIPCMYGYAATKMGDHATAMRIFEKCIATGMDAAYPWESYMSQNGFGTRKSLEDAANWDRQSAERGYKIGQFNYGLSLLRGYGVRQDVEAGKKLIDSAAALGLDVAQEVKDAGYDPGVAIPDADLPRIY